MKSAICYGMYLHFHGGKKNVVQSEKYSTMQLSMCLRKRCHQTIQHAWSALHGLGHIQSSCIERVTEVITNFLKKVSVSTQLTTYAKQAILGNVQ